MILSTHIYSYDIKEKKVDGYGSYTIVIKEIYMPRKSEINKETMTKIADLVMEGHTMATVARKIGVAKGSIYRWIGKFPELKEMIQAARVLKAESYMDEIVEIADDRSHDLIEDLESGQMRPNAAAVARAKLQIDTRRKLAAIIKPEAFGEKSHVDITSNGNDVFTGFNIIMPEDK